MPYINPRKLIWSLVIIMAGAFSASGSHIPGGDITYTCLGNNQYEFTLTLHVRCPATLSTSYTLNFTNTCGYPNQTLTVNLDPNWPQDVSAICDSSLNACNGGPYPGVMQYLYTGIITLPGPCNTWTVSYSLCCRNSTINVSGQPSFYVETTMYSQTNNCNNSPYIPYTPSNPPNMVPYYCVNIPVNHPYGFIDPDGDSLVYSLVCPQSSAGTPLTFNVPYSCAQPIPGIVIDPQTGVISFTATVVGSYIIAIAVNEYDPVTGQLLSTVIHDIQFEIINSANCTNNNPVNLPPGGIGNFSGTGTQIDSNSVQMCVGDNFCMDLLFTDPDGDSLTIDFEDITTILSGAIMTTTYIGTGNDSMNINICWTALPGSPSSNYTTISVVDDGSCPIGQPQSFTMDISVVQSTWAGPDITICGPQWAALSASGGSQFTWNTLAGDPINIPTNFSCNPCQNPQAQPGITTTYEVTSNLSGGCVNTDTVTVFVVPDYTYSITPDTILCDIAGVQLNVNPNPAGAYTYNWDPASLLSNPAIANPLATPTQTTDYYVTITSPQGCAKTDSVNVFVNNPINLNITPGDTSICAGSSLQLDAAPVNTVFTDDFDPGIDMTMWSSIQGNATTNGCGSMSGNALYFNGSGTREAVTVPLNTTTCTSISFCLVIGSGSSPCENADSGEDVYFEYSTNGGVTWNPIQTFLQSSWDITPGFQCFTINLPPGAIGSNVMFSWNQPNHSGTIDNWALDDISISCATPNGYLYNWSPSAGLSSTTISNPLANPGTNTTYIVTVTDSATGCFAMDTINITVAPDFNYTLTTSTTSACMQDSIQFIVTPDSSGLSYSWSPGNFLNDSTIASPSAVITQPGNFTFDVLITSTGGCSKLDSVNLTIAPAVAPIFTLTNDTAICGGNPVQLDAVVGNFTPATCGPSATGCNGTPSTITVGTGAASNTGTTYPAPYGNWYWGARHQFLYTAAELNALGFTGGQITELAFNVAAVNGTTSYMNFEIRMSCTSLSSLTSWQTGLTTVFPAQNLFVTTGWNTHVFSTPFDWDGISNVIVEVCFNNSSYTNNCQTFYTPTTFSSALYYRADMSTVCYNGTPTSSTNRPNTRFGVCSGSAPAGTYSYQWNPTAGLSSSTISNPLASPMSTTTYVVTVTNTVGGCFNVDSVTIGVTNPYNLTLVTVDDTCNQACAGLATVGTNGGTPPFTYSWSNGAPSATTATGLCAGNYQVTVSDSLGCSRDTSFTINEPTLLVLDSISTVDASCNSFTDGSLTIWASGGTPPYQYSDDNGLTWSSINLSSMLGAGTYDCVVSDSFGCTATLQTVINEPLLLAVSTVPDTTVCVSTCATVSAMASGGTSPYAFAWDQGLAAQSSNSACPASPTTYSVTVTDANGCISNISSTTVSLYPPLTVSASSGGDVCPGYTTALTATASGGIGGPYTYTWSPSSGLNDPNISNPFATPQTTTTYTVSVQDGCGTPLATDDTTVAVYPLPALSISSDTVDGCEPLTVNFTNTTQNTSNCLWYFGNGTMAANCNASTTFAQAGTYDLMLVITTPEGCQDSLGFPDYIKVYENPVADFNINPQPTTTSFTDMYFTDQSIGSVNTWNWDFSGLGTSMEQNVSFTYPQDTGTFPVYLSVTTGFNCTADTVKYFTIGSEYLIWIPNAFTPDNDGDNDYFYPKGINFYRGEQIDGQPYKLMIFDRWGELIWASEAWDVPWDGSSQKAGGAPVQEGVYVYKVIVKDNTQFPKTHEYIGHVTVIR